MPRKGVTISQAFNEPIRRGTDPLGPGVYEDGVVVGESTVMKRGDLGAPFGPTTARGDAAGPFGERPVDAVEAELDDKGGALDGDRLVLSPHLSPTRKSQVQGIG